MCSILAKPNDIALKDIGNVFLTRTVAMHCKKEEAERCKTLRDKLVREKARRDAMHQTAVREEMRLSKVHMITSSDELKTMISEIDDQPISAKRKSETKHALLREQVNIQRKVLKKSRYHLHIRGENDKLSSLNSLTS